MLASIDLKLGKPFDVLGCAGRIPTYTLCNCGLSFDFSNCMLSENGFYTYSFSNCYETITI